MPAFSFAGNNSNDSNDSKNSVPKNCDFPVFLQKVMQVAESDQESDLLVLGSITALSACLGRVYGIYDGRRVYPNLFLFVTAPASAGKGRLIGCSENRLFSRFMFDYLNVKPEWKNVFALKGYQELDEYLKNLGEEFL